MPRLSHVTERGRETLHALREALFALMVEKDFEQITVKDITDRAQIDRTTFYLHCRDKRDLFVQGQQQLIADLFEHFPPELPLEERLRQAFDYMAAHATAYRALLGHGDAATEQSMETFLAQHIERALEQSPLGVDVDSATRAFLAQALTNVIRGAAKWWLARPTLTPPAEMAHLVQQFLARGLQGFLPDAPDQA